MSVECLPCVRDSGWCINAIALDPHQSRELGRLSPTLQIRKLRLQVVTCQGHTEAETGL